jgi:quercetin dioxygenase-like cupin family protein
VNATSIANAEHYLWGQACDGWRLLATDDLSVIEERMHPGSFEQRHFHTRAHQFFYVLQGDATLELDGITHRLQRGDGLHIPPGIAHQARSDGTQDVRFIMISAPKAHGDRVMAPLAFQTS